MAGATISGPSTLCRSSQVSRATARCGRTLGTLTDSAMANLASDLERAPTEKVDRTRSWPGKVHRFTGPAAEYQLRHRQRCVISEYPEACRQPNQAATARPNMPPLYVRMLRPATLS